MKFVEIETGVCHMCQQRPAEYADLVCRDCKDAIDRGDEWVLAYPDVLLLLDQWEGEEDYR